MEEMHTRRVLEPIAWILQLISGIFLTVLVTFHFYVTHFVEHNAMEYDKVIGRFTDPAYQVMYVLLLLFVSFHAFNGLRAIILDTNFGAKHARAVNTATFLLFFAVFGYGLVLLFSF